MDTRNKILTTDGAVELGTDLRRKAIPLQTVTGHFDVLTTEHVRDLETVRNRLPGAKLLVIVTPSADSCLESRARAELVAALRVVDYVVAVEPNCRETLLSALAPAEVTALESADERRVRHLIDHVHRRQAG